MKRSKIIPPALMVHNSVPLEIHAGRSAQGPKFTKAFQTEENEQKLSDFLNVEERAFIFCPESLRCETVMPKKVPKGKTLVFMKVLRGAVTADGIAREVMVMEMGGNTPFEHLELLAHEVFLPILSNAQNQAKWGEVPTREIMDRFYGFLSSTTILCGQIKGETRLPMPPMDIGGASSGKNRISLLEGAIITWTKQIKSVLKQDPESQLKQGMHPTPDVEIDFWKNKVNVFVSRSWFGLADRLAPLVRPLPLVGLSDVCKGFCLLRELARQSVGRTLLFITHSDA